MAHFSEALFTFLLELQANNSRDWFKANKSRYESAVKLPLLAFITEFGPHMRSISKAFVADPRPVGGSMFRIYRDTRFSKDKAPYKTHAAAHFRHVLGKDVHAPGFYLHLAPTEVFVGAGIWKPESASLKKIRDAIVEEPERWTAMKAAMTQSGLTIDGESLKRPPRGYDKEHPLVEDLKRKTMFSSVVLTTAAATSDNFVEQTAAACKQLAPLVHYLTDALGLEY